MTNAQRFQAALTNAYRDLFEDNPEYAVVAARVTPEVLAARMTTALANGTANHDSIGIRRACRAVGIKTTKTAIRAFLLTND